MTRKREIEKRLADLEDERGGDNLAEMEAGQVYMEMLRANAEGDEEREARAWREYQHRLEALESEAESDESNEAS